jgi:hypothetical protein
VRHRRAAQPCRHGVDLKEVWVKKLIAPLSIALVLALVVTMALFFWVSLAAGDLSGGGSSSLDLGPLRFVTVSREVTAEGSTASIVPGLGLLVLWGFAIGYGLLVGLRRAKATPVPVA